MGSAPPIVSILLTNDGSLSQVLSRQDKDFSDGR